MTLPRRTKRNRLKKPIRSVSSKVVNEFYSVYTKDRNPRVKIKSKNCSVKKYRTKRGVRYQLVGDKKGVKYYRFIKSSDARKFK